MARDAEDETRHGHDAREIANQLALELSLALRNG
jgi:hypothetical protein